MFTNDSFLAILFMVVAFFSLVVLMVLLVRWARRRSSAAIAAGALLSVFAPDPTLERNIKLAEEAKTIQSEEDKEGEK